MASSLLEPRALSLHQVSTVVGLPISTRFLVFSAAECCAPVWNRSCHTKKTNNALRTITGCLCATLLNHLPILAGIAPVNLHREGATLALARRAMKNASHLLHKVMMNPPVSWNWLKSHRPFTQAAHLLLQQSVAPNVSRDTWLKNRWTTQRQQATPSLLHLPMKAGEELPRRQWTVPVKSSHAGNGPCR